MRRHVCDAAAAVPEVTNPSRPPYNEPWYGEWLALVVELIEGELPDQDHVEHFWSKVDAQTVYDFIESHGLQPERIFEIRPVTWTVTRARVHLGMAATKRRARKFRKHGLTNTVEPAYA